jgi:RES domain-containing protein
MEQQGNSCRVQRVEYRIAAGATALLLVPSVIVPDEYDVLIKPQHGDTSAIVATTLKRWIYDPRFFP